MNNRLSVNTDLMGSKTQAFRQQADRIEDIAQRIVDCRKQLQLEGSGSVLLKLQLNHLRNEVLSNAAKMDTLAAALDQIVNLYVACEQKAAGAMVEGAWSEQSSGNADRGTDKRKWWQKAWDWLWDKDTDPKYTHTTREQEAAADRHMKRQIENLYNTDRYSEETWKNASVEERKQILEDFMNEVAEIMGIDVKDNIRHLNQAPENNMILNGQYNRSSNRVSINMWIVENRSPERSYQLMTTIVHELRHAYQYAAVEDPTKFQVSQETIDSWKDSFNNYKSTDGFMRKEGMSADEAYQAYRNQAVERDARSFAGQD